MRPALEDPVGLLWRRRWRFLGVLVACLVAVTTVTLLLERTYEATATLAVSPADEAVSADQLVRTYTALAANPNIVDAARRELPFEITRRALLERLSFAPVARTQLLEITAEAPRAGEAREIANIYAGVFTSRVALGSRGRPTVRIAEPAVLPLSPTKPDRALLLGLGAGLSLLLAMAAVIAGEALSPRLRVRDDDTRLGDAPIVGRIPRIDKAPDGAVDDAFHWLRTSLERGSTPPPQVIAVTSPGDGEGKSTVAAHLGIAYASAGMRTLVLEADLRRPGLVFPAHRGRLERSQTGLAEMLQRGDVPLLTVDPDLPTLSILWAGSPQADPAVLVDSDALRASLAAWRERFDRIVIDTPPLTIGADASVLGAIGDGAICVVDLPSTTPVAARVGLEKLNVVGVRALGVVVNRAPLADVAGYYRSAPGPAPAPARADAGP